MKRADYFDRSEGPHRPTIEPNKKGHCLKESQGNSHPCGQVGIGLSTAGNSKPRLLVQVLGYGPGVGVLASPTSLPHFQNALLTFKFWMDKYPLTLVRRRLRSLLVRRLWCVDIHKRPSSVCVPCKTLFAFLRDPLSAFLMATQGDVMTR